MFESLAPAIARLGACGRSLSMFCCSDTNDQPPPTSLGCLVVQLLTQLKQAHIRHGTHEMSVLEHATNVQILNVHGMESARNTEAASPNSQSPHMAASVSVAISTRIASACIAPPITCTANCLSPAWSLGLTSASWHR